MVLVAKPRPNSAVAESTGWVGAPSESVARIMVSESATWVLACLLRMALLSLWLHWGFTIFYLDLATPTKAF